MILIYFHLFLTYSTDFYTDMLEDSWLWILQRHKCKGKEESTFRRVSGGILGIGFSAPKENNEEEEAEQACGRRRWLQPQSHLSSLHKQDVGRLLLAHHLYLHLVVRS